MLQGEVLGVGERTSEVLCVNGWAKCLEVVRADNLTTATHELRDSGGRAFNSTRAVRTLRLIVVTSVR